MKVVKLPIVQVAFESWTMHFLFAEHLVSAHGFKHSHMSHPFKLLTLPNSHSLPHDSIEGHLSVPVFFVEKFV